MVNWAGDVERIAASIVLRLKRGDGKTLVQIAEGSDDHFRIACRQPGKNLGEGEDPAEAFKKLLDDSAFTPFIHAFTFTDIELEVSWSDAKRMSVATKYLKTVSTAELTCPAECLGLENTLIESLPPVETLLNLRRRAGRFQRAFSFSTMSSTSSSMSHGSNDESVDVDIDAIDAFLAADRAGRLHLVGWLSPDALSFFASPHGEDILQERLGHVVVQPSMVERAHARFAADLSMKVRV